MHLDSSAVSFTCHSVWVILISIGALQSAGGVAFSPATPTRRRGYVPTSAHSPFADGAVFATLTPTRLVSHITRSNSMYAELARGGSHADGRQGPRQVPRKPAAVANLAVSAAVPDSDDKSSSWATGFNIINVFVGLGLLSKPYAFAKVCCVVARLSDLSFLRLAAVWCRRLGGVALAGVLCTDMEHTQLSYPSMKPRCVVFSLVQIVVDCLRRLAGWALQHWRHACWSCRTVPKSSCCVSALPTKR